MGKTLEKEEEQPIYYSYLLRLWQEDTRSHSWRMSLENARTGERSGFVSLDALFEFLYQQIIDPSQANTDQVERGGVIKEIDHHNKRKD